MPPGSILVLGAHLNWGHLNIIVGGQLNWLEKLN